MSDHAINEKGFARFEHIFMSMIMNETPLFAVSSGLVSGNFFLTADLYVVLQAPDQLAVHLPRLSHPDTAPLGLAEAILQDATGLPGLLQLQPQLLQLVHLLFLEHVTYLQHLAAKLLHLILLQTTQVHIFVIQGKLEDL